MAAYTRNGGKPSIAQEANNYLPLIKRIAFHFCNRLPPNIMPEDMIQVGFVALMDLLKTTDERGEKFEAYVATRVRGAMIDELRSADYYPRSVRNAQRVLEEAENALKATLLRKPTAKEIAEKLGISMADYIEMVSKSCSGVVSTDQSNEDDEGSQTNGNLLDRLMIVDSQYSDYIDTEELKIALVEAISSLSEREQAILTMYYFEEMVISEIALVMGLTETRISQIFNQSLVNLRVKMDEWAGENTGHITAKPIVRSNPFQTGSKK